MKKILFLMMLLTPCLSFPFSVTILDKERGIVMMESDNDQTIVVNVYETRLKFLERKGRLHLLINSVDIDVGNGNINPFRSAFIIKDYSAKEVVFTIFNALK